MTILSNIVPISYIIWGQKLFIQIFINICVFYNIAVATNS